MASPSLPARSSAARGTAEAPRRAPLRSRLLVAGLGGLSALLSRLPDGLLHRLAHAAGALLYWLRPARRALVRGNLLRVCRHLAAAGLVAPGSAAHSAAEGGRALDRLTRAAFGHYVRGYLEVLLLAAYARRPDGPPIETDDPALAAEAFGSNAGRGRAIILIGMHFGAIEIPGLWTSRQGLRLTAPMETLADPSLQAYLEQKRGVLGLRIVPLGAAGRELRAALARGEAVALIADRLVGGSGARVELFGSPARLPVGAAVLALESGAPAWLAVTRRLGWGGYRVFLERIELPAEGPRRERLASFLTAQASAFERAVAKAPEQWWALFFPIWTEEAR
ncbi:MAG TPA: lysophospholipid acyltransferase family protein [Candidatus Limnocylindria bacterium]|nr:lysophospholipid acyltransferase family protein [Candidatus Limnocylindria bacterium]